MKMEIDQGLKNKQEQMHSFPTVQIQSLHILEWNNYELEQFIRNELNENPLLEFYEKSGSEENTFLEHGNNISIDSGDKYRLTEYEKIYGETYGEMYGERYGETYEGMPGGRYGGEEEQEFDIPADEGNEIREYLWTQLNLNNYSKKELKVIEFMIESLDERGYLTLREEEIAKWNGVSIKLVQKCLNLIRSLEPMGIAASGLCDCLCRQLDFLNYKEEKLFLLVKNHLEDIAFKRYKKIAYELGLTQEKVKEYIHIIRTLNPRPMNGFNTIRVQYIIPDIIFFRNESGLWDIRINDKWTGNLKVVQVYNEQVKHCKDRNVIDYINEKRKRAGFIIGCIEQRRKTIFHISKYVTEYQNVFLNGKGDLKPLTLKMAGDKLGIHESTVSRAIKDKYVECPKGTFLFKTFFANGINSREADGDITAKAAKEKIRKLIDTENKKKPYSDSQLTKLLLPEVKISRRTVAKYREQMGISGTYDRKEQG